MNKPIIVPSNSQIMRDKRIIGMRIQKKNILPALAPSAISSSNSSGFRNLFPHSEHSQYVFCLTELAAARIPVSLSDTAETAIPLATAAERLRSVIGVNWRQPQRGQHNILCLRVIEILPFIFCFHHNHRGGLCPRGLGEKQKRSAGHKPTLRKKQSSHTITNNMAKRQKPPLAIRADLSYNIPCGAAEWPLCRWV